MIVWPIILSTLWSAGFGVCGLLVLRSAPPALPGRCGTCGYALRGREEAARCPECGAALADVGTAFTPRGRSRAVAVVGWGLVVVAALPLIGMVAVLAAFWLS